MSYLFGQTWVWMIAAFVAGSLLVWLPVRLFGDKAKVTVSEIRSTHRATR